MKLKPCFVFVWAMVGGMLVGQALAQESSVWKNDREAAVLLTPSKVTWYTTRFLLYDFPKAALCQLPTDNVRRFSQPEKSKVARLMGDLNDDDLLVKDFIILELKRLTGQSFGYKPLASSREELKASIDQWNQWWEKNPG